ncbi:MAG: cupin domain-containing protein [Rhodobacteraceae bacterium]|nr:cupin domain-containing protein [Paracoccaceae bacterium]
MPKVDPALAATSAHDGCTSLRLSMAGGITQFGAYIETVAQGAWTSERHWHDAEDEFAYVLDGTVTLHDDTGLHDLAAGDAVCWPHGDPNAHHMTNRGRTPARLLVVGTRVACDICRYPDSGRVQVNSATGWQVLDRDGTVLRGGDLPAELMNLPPVWGQAFTAPAAGRLQRADARIWVEEAAWTHPVLGASLGPYRHVVLGDPGGLSQFGAHLEALPPGTRSSLRHWHEAEDEMVLMLSGDLMLIEDDETPLGPGDAACWPAGWAVGHCLENRSAAEAVYLVLGTRKTRDVIHYPDHDLITVKDGAARSHRRGDGTPIAPRRTE